MSGQAAWLGTASHARWLEAEGDRLLDFSRAARHPSGGFAWLDVSGRPALDRPVELWITCRMTHVFSLGHLLGRPGCGPLADHGLAALTGRFRDATNGGWYAAVDADGPTGRAKAAYPHAFVVLAAASATCAGRPGAAELLDEALDVLLTRFWDEEHGMVVEEWDESFSTLDAYRGVNANMHTVEALLAATDATGDRTLLDKALRILTRVVHDLGRGNDWRLPEHFDEQWTPLLEYNVDKPADPFRPYGATIGHWLEWSRLALNLRAALGSDAPDWMLDDADRPVRRLGPRGLGDRRCGRVRLHRELVRRARGARADALGRGGGDGHGCRPPRGDRRRGVRRVVRDLVGPHRRGLPRPRAGIVAARAGRRRTAPAARSGTASRTPTTRSRRPCSRGFR